METQQNPWEESKHYDVFKSAIQSDLEMQQIESENKEAQTYDFLGKVTPTSQNYIG